MVHDQNYMTIVIVIPYNIYKTEQQKKLILTLAQEKLHLCTYIANQRGNNNSFTNTSCIYKGRALSCSDISVIPTSHNIMLPRRRKSTL